MLTFPLLLKVKAFKREKNDVYNPLLLLYGNTYAKLALIVTYCINLVNGISDLPFDPYSYIPIADTSRCIYQEFS